MIPGLEVKTLMSEVLEAWLKKCDLESWVTMISLSICDLERMIRGPIYTWGLGSGAVLRIRITLKRNRILLVNLMRIQILLVAYVDLDPDPDPNFHFDADPDPS